MRNWPIGRYEQVAFKWNSDIFCQVLPEAQLIFFPVAPTALCFGFVLTAD